MESAVFAKRYLAEGAQALDATFLFVIALQPNLTVRMRVCKSFEKRGRTVFVEIHPTDKRCDWIIGARGRRTGRTEEWVRDMAGNENTLDTKVDTVMGKIGEVDPPIFFALIDMRFEDKAVDTILLSKESLVILTIVFVRDAGVKM
jgi:hypothetical protein